MVLQGEALQGKSDGAVVGDDDVVGEEDNDYDSDDDLSETSKELQGLARNSTEVPLWAVSILSVSRTLWEAGMYLTGHTICYIRTTRRM